MTVDGKTLRSTARSTVADTLQPPRRLERARGPLALGLAEVGDHDNDGSALPAFPDLLDL